MTYDIAVEEKKDYIRAEVFGLQIAGNNMLDSKDLWLYLAEAGMENQASRILAVSWVTGHLPAPSAYEIVAELDRLGFDKDFRISLVFFDSKSFQDNLFGEQIAADKGYRIRVFSNVVSAERWLLGSTCL